jgi:hypothetical protein
MSAPGTPAAAHYRRERMTYVRGFVLAAVPFVMEGTGGDSRTTLLWVIGAFGLAQILVHVRYFLHVEANWEGERPRRFKSPRSGMPAGQRRSDPVLASVRATGDNHSQVKSLYRRVGGT